MSAQAPQHSVSVAAAVVDHGGRLLVIKRRDNGRWEPPGGVLELNEDIHAGLAREVREETGVTVRPGALTGVYKNLSRGIVALVFRCTEWEGAPQATAEAEAVAWMTPEEVKDKLDETYAIRLLDALRPGPAAVRAHDGQTVLGASNG